MQLLSKFNYTIVCVAANKQRLTDEQKTRLTCPKLYHYLAKHIVERLSWLGRQHGQQVVLHFSSRKQIHFGKLHEYLFTTIRHERVKTHDTDYRFIGGCGEALAKRNLLSQASDWVASGIAAGLNPDKYGNTEYEYCRAMWGKFWVRKGNLWSYGFKCLPTNCIHRAEQGLLRKIGTWLEDPTTLV